MDSVYERFCELLKEHNVKAADVSRATGIKSTVFSEWKKGKARPKTDKLQKIAEYFNVSLEYLMTGESPKRTINTLSQEAITFYDLFEKADKETRDYVLHVLRHQK